MKNKPRDLPAIEASIAEIDLQSRRLTTSFLGMSSPGAAVYLQHFLVAAAIDRTLSNVEGFKLLLADNNFLCAASVLRLQIDTAMRSHAFNIVSDPNQLAKAIVQGERFERFEDIKGNKLKDWYLRRRLAEHFPWIEEVYEQTSGTIHFSARHISSSLSPKLPAEGTIEFQLTGKAKGPNPDFRGIAAAFAAAVKMTHRVVFPDE